MKTLVFCLTLLVVCTISTPALSVQLYSFDDKALVLDIENSLGFEWHNNHQFDTGSQNIATDDYIKLNERLSLRLRFNGFTIGFLANALYYPDQLFKKRTVANNIFELQASANKLWLDRYYLRYASKNLKIDLGDFYVTFGRGLALAMRREGEGDVDNSLRGGKVEFAILDTRLIALAGFSNTISIDPSHEQPQEDPFDLISGLRLEQRIADYLTLGVQFTGIRFAALESDYVRNFVTENENYLGGGSLEIPDIAGYVSFYFEGNYLHRSGREVDDTLMNSNAVNDSGYGLYSSLSLFVKDFTMTAEYKLYNDFYMRRGRTKLGYILPKGETAPEGLDFFEDIYYNNAPTLERKDIETNREYGNDHGFRIKANYNVEKTQTNPYVAFYFTINKHKGQGTTNLGGLGGNSSSLGDRIWHVYGGINQNFGNLELYLDAGFRDEFSRDTKQKLLTMIHAKAGVLAPVVANHVLGFEAFYLRKNYKLLGELEDNIDFTLSYSFARYFTLSFLYTFQNKEFLPGFGINEINHYLAGEIRTNFLSWLEASIFAGQVRESYRCYGGFCRLVPPFEGVKAKLKFKF